MRYRTTGETMARAMRTRLDRLEVAAGGAPEVVNLWPDPATPRDAELHRLGLAKLAAARAAGRPVILCSNVYEAATEPEGKR